MIYGKLYQKEIVMNRNTRTSSLTEAAMVCGILVVMGMFSTYIFPFIDFFFPVPALIFSKRRGFKYASLASIAASLIITITLGIPQGYIYMFVYTPMAVIMSYLIDKNKKASIVLLGGAVVIMVSTVFSLFLLDKFIGVSISEQITSMLKEILDIQKGIMNSVGTAKEQVKEYVEMYENFIESTILLLPVTIIASSVALAYINYVVSQRLALKFKIEIRQLKDIAFFSLPGNFMIGVGFLLLLSYILGKTNFPNADIISSNILMFGRLALIIQGLALAKFYMVRIRVRNFLRVVVFILILFNPMLLGLMTIIALADLIFDFRKLRVKN